MDIKQQLHQSYLCSGLSKEEIHQIAKITAIKKIAKKKILFLEGDRADGFYLVLKGRIKVYKTTPEGKENALHEIQKGQTFAEAAMFGKGHYPANSMAMEDSLVALIPKKGFLDVLKKYPSIALKMIGSLSSFLREFNQTIENLSLKEVPARLATYLIAEHQKIASKTIFLKTTKSELASQLGTISETLSRNLRKFKDQKTIRVEGNKITLLNVPLLSSIANGEKI